MGRLHRMAAQARKRPASKVVKRLKRPAAAGAPLAIKHTQSHEGPTLTTKEVQRKVREYLKCSVAFQTGARRGSETRIRIRCRECLACGWRGVARYSGKTLTIETSSESAHGNRDRPLGCKD